MFLKGRSEMLLRSLLRKRSAQEQARQNRGWKLLVLLPRMLLHHGPRGGLVPKSKLVERFQLFSRGEWHILLEASAECDQQAAITRCRSRKRVRDDDECRAAKAAMLVSIGELSSARQALEGAQLASGDQETLNSLRNPTRRPVEGPFARGVGHFPAASQVPVGPRPILPESEVSPEGSRRRSLSHDHGTFATFVG